MSKRLLLVLLTLLNWQHLSAQKSDNQKLEDLKLQIKQATYYDSSTVFSLGEQCIRLAKKLKKENEIGNPIIIFGGVTKKQSEDRNHIIILGG